MEGPAWGRPDLDGREIRVSEYISEKYCSKMGMGFSWLRIGGLL
jgi:hypothetical protein